MQFGQCAKYTSSCLNMRYNCVTHPSSSTYPHHKHPAYLKKKIKRIGMRHNVSVRSTNLRLHKISWKPMIVVCLYIQSMVYNLLQVL